MSPASSSLTDATDSSSRLFPSTVMYTRSPSPMSSGPPVGVHLWSWNPQSRFDAALAEDERRWVEDQGRPDRRLPPMTSNTRSQINHHLSQSVARAHQTWEEQLAAAGPSRAQPASAAMTASTSLRPRPRSGSFELPPEHQRYPIRRAQSPSPEDVALDESQPGHAHHLASRSERESSPYPFLSVAGGHGDDGQVLGNWQVSLPAAAPAWQEPPPSERPPLPPPPSRWATVYPAARPVPDPRLSTYVPHGAPTSHEGSHRSDATTSQFYHPPGLFPRRPRRSEPSPPPGQSLFSFAAETEISTDEDEFGDEAAGLLSVHTTTSADRPRPVLPSLGIDITSPRANAQQPSASERLRQTFLRDRASRIQGWGPEMGSDQYDDEALQTARLELEWATRASDAGHQFLAWQAVPAQTEKGVQSVQQEVFATEIRCGTGHGSAASIPRARSSPTYLYPHPSLAADSLTDTSAQAGCNALLLVTEDRIPMVDLKFASLGSVGRGGGPSRTTYETVYPISGNVDGQGLRFGTVGEGHSSRCGCRDKREVACLNCGHTIGFHISAPCFLHSRDSQPSANSPARCTPFPRIMHGDPLRSRYDNPAASSSASYTRRSDVPRSAVKEGGLWGFREGDLTIQTATRAGKGTEGKGAKKRKRVMMELESEEGIGGDETEMEYTWADGETYGSGMPRRRRTIRIAGR